jgi:hypothetical protein
MSWNPLAAPNAPCDVIQLWPGDVQSSEVRLPDMTKNPDHL